MCTTFAFPQTVPSPKKTLVEMLTGWFAEKKLKFAIIMYEMHAVSDISKAMTTISFFGTTKQNVKLSK